jgi:RNA polymerase sigma factor (sigma-70 family)
MDDKEFLAGQFEQHRAHLPAVSYRMLGSLSEADDAVQEASVRLSRSDAEEIENFGGWLTTVVARVCLNMLRARKTRSEEPLDERLPDPVVEPIDGGHPEHEALLADSVGLALLVVLEQLSPAERLAFVLHDMFGVPFDEIAPIVDRTPVAARQLASRARRRLRGSKTAPDADLPTQRRVVNAFLAASRAGDFEDLLNLLDPDVVFRVDSGTRATLAPALLTGAADVAEHAAAHGPRFATLCEPALVNGAAGIIATTRGGVLAVVGITVIKERIAAIDLILDPDKLAGLTVHH